MGDADDFVYYNPTAGLAVGGGEEESPEEMSEAASAVYEMLLSSDSSILDMMLVMVELLGAREPLAAAPSPPLPPPPVPPPTPPPPPPPPSFLVTHLVDPIFVRVLCGIDRPMPLQALVSLVLVSKACRMALQGILEDRWVEALSSIVGYGEDPVGTHQRSKDFPLSAFTTVNNLPNSQAILSLLLPPSKLHHRDAIIKAWGVHNLLRGHWPALAQNDIRHQAKETLDKLLKQVSGRSNRLNVLVQGSAVIQLLENGLRPQYLFKLAEASMWDSLGVTFNRNLEARQIKSNLPESSRFGGFVVQARVINEATRNPNGVPGRPCKHNQEKKDFGFIQNVNFVDFLLKQGFDVVVLLVGLQAGNKLFSALTSRSNVFVTTTYHPVLVSNNQRDKTTTAAARLTLAAGARLMCLALNVLTGSSTEARTS